MNWLRRLYAVLIFPGLVLGVAPAILLWAFHGPLAPPQWTAVAPALALFGLSGAIAIWTADLFVRIGGGTIIPWYPPRKLVVAGPYRYVRNPMIISVVLFLVAESLLFGSWPILAWAAVVLAVNLLYYPLSEERSLESRFGEDYRIYRENVPRIIPRLRPWTLPIRDAAD